jgi:putative ABC transport system permease protein
MKYKYFLMLSKNNLQFNKQRMMLTGVGIVVGMAFFTMIAIIVSSFTHSLTSDLINDDVMLIASSKYGDLTYEFTAHDELEFLDKLDKINNTYDNVHLEAQNVEPKLVYDYKGTKYSDITYRFSNPLVSNGKGFNTCASNCVIISNANANAVKMLGESITIANVSYLVIGTTNDYQAQMFFPQYLKNEVISLSELSKTGVYTISAQKDEIAKSDISAIIDMLNSGDVPYVFSNLSEDIQLSIIEVTNSLTLFGMVIGSISLFIASINMFNIMYISAIERKKEVALLRSFGVKKRIIRLCFLAESVSIVAFFSIIGSIFGLGITWIMLTFMHIPIFFNVHTVLLGLAMILLIGVLSGYSPARKAAEINPTILLK